MSLERKISQACAEMEAGFDRMGEIMSRDLAHAFAEANRRMDVRFDESRLLIERVERRLLLATVGIGGVIVAAVGLISALT